MTQQQFINQLIDKMDILAASYAENSQVIRERNRTCDFEIEVETLVSDVEVILSIYDEPWSDGVFTIRSKAISSMYPSAESKIQKRKVYSAPNSIYISKKYNKNRCNKINDNKYRIFFDDSYDNYVDSDRIKRHKTETLTKYIKENISEMYKDEINIKDMSDIDFENLLKLSAESIITKREFENLKNKYRIKK